MTATRRRNSVAAIIAVAVLAISPAAASATSYGPGDVIPIGGTASTADEMFSGGQAKLYVDSQHRTLMVSIGEHQVSVSAQGQSTENAYPIVRRLTASGALDPSFGAGGVATGLPDPAGSSLNPASAVVEPDDSLLVVTQDEDTTGCTASGLATNFTGRVHVLHILANGHLDTSLGQNGIAALNAFVTPPAACSDNWPGVQSVIPNGAGGFLLGATSSAPGSQPYPTTLDTPVLYAFHFNGSVDSTFGANGAAKFQNVPGRLAAVIRLSDNALEVISDDFSNSYFWIGRMTAAGVPDASFGNQTIYARSAGTTYANATGAPGTIAWVPPWGTSGLQTVVAAAAPAGGIALAGTAYANFHANNAYVERIDASGSPLQSFGTAGIVTAMTPTATDDPQGQAFPTWVGVNVANDVVVLGSYDALATQQTIQQETFLKGFGASGAIDPGFGSHLITASNPDDSVTFGGIAATGDDLVATTSLAGTDVDYLAGIAVTGLCLTNSCTGISAGDRTGWNGVPNQVDHAFVAQFGTPFGDQSGGSNTPDPGATNGGDPPPAHTPAPITAGTVLNVEPAQTPLAAVIHAAIASIVLPPNAAAALKLGIAQTLTCPGACTLHVQLTVTATVAKQIGLLPKSSRQRTPVVVGTASGNLASGGSVKVHVMFTRAAKAKLAHLRTVTLVDSVRTSQGSTSSRTLTLHAAAHH